MDDKFAKFNLAINKMRQKVIATKGGQRVQGLSEPTIQNKEDINKKRIKIQEKD